MLGLPSIGCSTKAPQTTIEQKMVVNEEKGKYE